MSYWKNEWKPLFVLIAVFLFAYYMPLGNERFDNAIIEALNLVKWYAREHVILCLIPAFFIAGGISVFISQASVMTYLGPDANKVLSYSVASVSGSILAVCSCTVLPLFAGIYKMGAGLGPACAFLYSGPAINVLAIILSARILGVKIGIARAVLAIVFSIIIGLAMHLVFRKEESQKVQSQPVMPESKSHRSLLQNVIFFASMVAILIFANWAKPKEAVEFWNAVYSMKWILTSVSAIVLALVLILWFGLELWKVAATAILVLISAILWGKQPLIPFSIAIIGLSVIASSSKGEAYGWFDATWGFAKQIFPLLFAGVLVSGALLGSPGSEGLIPSEIVEKAVGGNSLRANFFASIVGAFMYFATLTEIPIVQGLVKSGMGQGPALALLLAGPALSLPSMLVIKSIMGTKKTMVFITLVVIMATISGMIFGSLDL